MEKRTLATMLEQLKHLFPIEKRCYASSDYSGDYLKELNNIPLEDVKNKFIQVLEQQQSDPSGKIKNYKYLIVYGDALVSGVYAVYAQREIQRLYGENAEIVIVQHHATEKRKDSLAAKQMLERLGAKVATIIDDEELDEMDNSRNLLFVPQHRVIHAKENISNSTDIYTIPEEEVRIYDGDLAIYYVDCGMEIFRRRKQHQTDVADWKSFLREHFSQNGAQSIDASQTIVSLVAKHLPRLRLLYEN